MSDEASEEPDDAPVAPLLRVITPGTTPEEVAAIVAVLAALGGGDDTSPPAPAREWNTPRRLHRRTFPSGPGAWRASGLPH